VFLLKKKRSWSLIWQADDLEEAAALAS